jgi:RTX calcium-binding nonapeptide repeat (4 copies)
MSIVPIGGQYLVNTEVSNGQNGPRVAVLANGSYVVTWDDNSGAGGDTNYGIKAQMFGAGGLKIGGEFLVNTITSGLQGACAVAPLAGGGFVITWVDDSGASGDLGQGDVRAQIFSDTGAAIGGEFLVNTFINSYQTMPKAAGLANGNFIISWQDFGANGAVGVNDSVTSQIFSATGAKIGGAFVNNTTYANFELQPVVTSLAGGGYVVAWQDYAALMTGPVGAIRAQIYDAANQPVGGEFLADANPALYQHSPKLTALPNGGFVLAWMAAAGFTRPVVTVQAFDALGNKAGAEFAANADGFNARSISALATLANGDIVVTWTEDADFSQQSLQARVFDAAGQPVGREFQVTDPQSFIGETSVAAFADGSFDIVWSANDGSGEGIIARHYAFLARIDGTAAPDVLTGGADDDFFWAAAGPDKVHGLGGSNTVTYAPDLAAGGTHGVFVDLVNNYGVDGFGATDLLYDISNVVGTNSLLTPGSFYSDFLYAGFGVNTFYGLGGNDYIVGSPAYHDSAASYALDAANGGAAGIYVDLNWGMAGLAGLARDGFGSFDTLINITKIVGTNGAFAPGSYYSDYLIGSWLGGTTFFGLGGNDYMEGRGANNASDYSLDAANGGAAGIYADLANGFVRDGFGSVDSLINIHDIIGTAKNDFIVGDSLDSHLQGGLGSDYVDGGLGINEILTSRADMAAGDWDIVHNFHAGDHLSFSADVNGFLGRSQIGADVLIYVQVGASYWAMEIQNTTEALVDAAIIYV